ncbi:alpha/beta hydrolase [Ureibacillus composti]|nr:alpha/beta hydrolase [Ureibacillus composti]
MGYYITVEPGVNIYIEDVNPGGEKTIVFIHGWPLSHKQFEYQFNILPTLGYRCIGIDWRGFGKSDKPFSGYTYNRLAEDLHHIFNALDLSDVTLVGHSTGGGIAIRYMSRYQGQGVSKLVLVSAAAPTGFTPENARQLLQETLSDRPKMMQGVTDQFFFQYITKPFSDWFNQVGFEAASWSTAAVIILLRDEKLHADLQRIQCPTLIIHGLHDKVIPFPQAKEMNMIIRNSQLVPFQYSGHGTFWEEQDKFNQVLHQFISG